MKTVRSIFSVLLVLILLAGSFEGISAEETSDSSTPTAQTADAEETPAPSKPKPDESGAPAPEERPTEAPSDSPDASGDEAESPAPSGTPETTQTPGEQEAVFVEGYACALKTLDVFESEDMKDEALATLPKDCVFYVLQCAERGWFIAFATADGVFEGWVDGDIARPLEEKETERYLKGKDDTWQAADGHPLMPLDLGGAEGEKEPSGETGASGKPESTEELFAGIGASGKPESTEEPSGQTNASGEESVQGPTAKTAGAPESIALSADSLMLGVKEKRMLGVLFTPSDRAETVSFSVSPKSVAVVAPDGTVKALKKGTATITPSPPRALRPAAR